MSCNESNCVSRIGIDRYGSASTIFGPIPGEAVTFLDNPRRLIPTPGELYSLRNQFRSDRDLQPELKQLYIDIDNKPGAHSHAFPWWKTALSNDGDVASAYRALNDYLHRFPRRAGVWNRRNVAWAAEVHAKLWVDHFHGQIRRSDTLRNSYFNFLNVVRAEPTLNARVEAAWLARHGKASSWPPDSEPTKLPAYAPGLQLLRSPSEPQIPTRESIMPQSPSPPSGQTVPAPKRPTAPGAQPPSADPRPTLESKKSRPPARRSPRIAKKSPKLGHFPISASFHLDFGQPVCYFLSPTPDYC